MMAVTFNSIPYNEEWIRIDKSQSRNTVPQNSEKLTFSSEVWHWPIPCPSCDHD